MGTKQEEVNKLTRGEGCLGKAEPDELVFILRAQDTLAARTVTYWAVEAEKHLGADHPKVIEAYDLAARMRAWPNRRLPD